VASVISKKINGKIYYYLAVSARVEGKPRIVEQKYLGPPRTSRRRRHAHQHDIDLSVRALLDALAGIEETVLLYPDTCGRPKAHRMITDTDQLQQHLFEIFQLHRWAPLGNTPNRDPHDS